MIKNCPKCNAKKIKRYGKTAAKKQRYLCLSCGKSFVWKNTKNKLKNESRWFRLWIKEGYSLRQLSAISGHSKEKLKAIKEHCLKEPVPKLYSRYSAVKYLIFDGTYFNKKNCLMLFMNNTDGKVISCRYLDKESYENAFRLSSELKSLGVEAKVITLDGHKAVIRAVKKIWRGIIIQRCLYHIQRQGLMWLRSKPKTLAGRELREIYLMVGGIKTKKERLKFSRAWGRWERKHKAFLKELNASETGHVDLKKAITLIKNARPNMWHFLKDKNIPGTTNKMEGYFSELKQQYGKHKGLSKAKRASYFKWYCYLKNIMK